MERSSVLRWGVIAIVIIVFWKFVLPYFTGSNDKPQSSALPAETYIDAPEFAPDVMDAPKHPGTPNPPPPEGELCTIKGVRFDAVASSRGAALVHLKPTDKQYSDFDLSTP